MADKRRSERNWRMKAYYRLRVSSWVSLNRFSESKRAPLSVITFALSLDKIRQRFKATCNYQQKQIATNFMMLIVKIIYTDPAKMFAEAGCIQTQGGRQDSDRKKQTHCRWRIVTLGSAERALASSWQDSSPIWFQLRPTKVRAQCLPS